MWGKVARVEKLLGKIDENREKSLIKFMNIDHMALVEVLPHILKRSINLSHEAATDDDPSLKMMKVIHFWPVSTTRQDSVVCKNSLANVLRTEDFSVHTSDLYRLIIGWLDIGEDIRKNGDEAKVRTKNLYSELVKRLVSKVEGFEAEIISASLTLQRETS